MALPYSTEAQVQSAAGGEEKLRQLSDINRENCVNSTEVANAVVRADSLINSYAKKRYAIPFDTVPGVIQDMSSQMAVYELKRVRQMVSDRDLELQDQRILWLRDLSRGVVALDLEEDAEKSEFVVDRSAARPSSKLVSRDKTKGFW